MMLEPLVHAIVPLARSSDEAPYVNPSPIADILITQDWCWYLTIANS